MTFIGSIRSGFGGVFRFAGRDARQSFWLYVAVIFGLTMISSFAIIVPTMSGSMERIQKFAADHPDQTTVTSGAGNYSIQVQGNHPELMPDMSKFISIWAVISLIAVILLAAAVARRLHDTGRSGWWGLMPVPFLGFGMIAMRVVMSSFSTSRQPDMGMFGLMFLNNIVYLGTLLALIIMLAGVGDAAENRFGPPSSR